MVEKVLTEYDVPPLPDDVERGHHLLGWTDATARPQLEIALQHSPALLVNALEQRGGSATAPDA